MEETWGEKKRSFLLGEKMKGGELVKEIVYSDKIFKINFFFKKKVKYRL